MKHDKLNNVDPWSGRRVWLAVVSLATLTACAAGPAASAAQAVTELDPKVERAVLAEDWPKVAELLKEVDTSHTNPVLRLIKGHACLAVNRNNEAVCLFLSLTNHADLFSCQNWADNLEAAHGDSAMGYYLAGDVCARLGHAEDAIALFSAGLAESPGNALILHARGVIHATRAAWALAREDLRQAVQTNSGLAEFHLSWANYLSGKKADPQKALDSYQCALDRSKDYVLALNGRGNMRTALQKWNGAAEDLDAAELLARDCLAGVASMVRTNWVLMARARAEAIQVALARESGISPGTDIRETLQKLETLPPNQRQRFVDGLGNGIQFNEALAKSPFVPNKIEVGPKIEAGINALGPFAQGGVEAKAMWDIKSEARINGGNQRDLLKAIEQRYGIQPNRISNVEGFMINHDNAIKPLLAPGGVSSAEIAGQTTIRNWSSATVYGLLYPMPAKALN